MAKNTTTTSTRARANLRAIGSAVRELGGVPSLQHALDAAKAARLRERRVGYDPRNHRGSRTFGGSAWNS